MSRKVLVKGYQVSSKIDEIGLKSYYHAMHLKSGKPVFLTLMPARHLRTQKALERRAGLSKKLLLSGIVSAMDYGLIKNETFFYSHKPISSLPIIDVVSEMKGKSEHYFTTAKFFIEALELLEYLHEAGTTHRDLGTQQIRVDSRSSVLMEGFINSRPKSEARNILNTVNYPYMSPEQLMGHSIDCRTDIYSMGVILFELITLSLPYESNYSKIEDVRQDVIPSPSMYCFDVPSELESIVMKMLLPKNARYRHVREIINDLEKFYAKRPMKQKMKDLSSSLKKLMSFPVLNR